MIKAVIIDDELHAREYLERIIERYFSNKILSFATCKNIKEGIEAIEKFNPDVVFLDINMQNESGFDLLKEIPKIEFEIIFTTAHSEFAIDAIKWSALDYLLKPINHLELATTIKRFEKKWRNKIEFDRFRLLIENISSDDQSNAKIAFPIENGFKVVKINSILYCQSDINYTKIYLNNGTSFILSKTLKLITELLPHSTFVRVHKSFLVNFNYVIYFNRGLDAYVELSNHIKIPVSTRKKDEVIQKLSSN
jgi:two-component system LytT family response regulator